MSGGITGCWGTYATRRAKRFGDNEDTVSPSTLIAPSWVTRPATAFSNVVLPAPLGPMSPTHSPESISSLNEQIAGTEPYRTVTVLREITADSSRASSHTSGPEDEQEERGTHERGDHPDRNLARRQHGSGRDVGQNQECRTADHRDRHHHPVTGVRRQ